MEIILSKKKKKYKKKSLKKKKKRKRHKKRKRNKKKVKAQPTSQIIKFDMICKAIQLNNLFIFKLINNITEYINT
jgi:hypothetical protein